MRLKSWHKKVAALVMAFCLFGGPGTAFAAAPVHYASLVKEVQTYLDKQPGIYAVSFKNLNNGKMWNIAGNSVIFAASTTKVPIVLDLYTQAALGKINLNTKLTYEPIDYEAGTGILQGYPYGSQFTLANLAYLAIHYSDNVAINMIFNDLGLSQISAFFRSQGGTVVFPNGQNFTTPNNLVSYMQGVLNFQHQDPTLGNTLLYNLEHTIYNAELPAGLPPGVTIAQKIGFWPGTVNDYGVIFGKYPYILAVMSKGINNSVAPSVEATVSKMVYNYQYASQAGTTLAADLASSGTYTVQAGDTLSSIAAKMLGNSSLWTQIYQDNRSIIRSHSLIYPGERLRLPDYAAQTIKTTNVAVTYKTYTVAAGDTLSSIASRFGVSLTSLQQQNRQKVINPSLIYPGEILEIP